MRSISILFALLFAASAFAQYPIFNPGGGIGGTNGAWILELGNGSYLNGTLPGTNMTPIELNAIGNGGIASGTILAITNGGTGCSAQSGCVVLVPSVSGESGKYLTNNGTASSWGAVTGSCGFEAPTATVGLTAVTGSTGDCMDAGSAPPLSQAIAPTWTGDHIFSPSSGTAIEVNGVSAQFDIEINSGSSATTSKADLIIQRAGSTANEVAEGPSVQIFDTTNNTASVYQQSGGQAEQWMYNGSAWTQVRRVSSGLQSYIYEASFGVNAQEGEATFQSSNCTLTWGGFSSAPSNETQGCTRSGATATVRISIQACSSIASGSAIGTSNAATFSVSGLPEWMIPLADQEMMVYPTYVASGATGAYPLMARVTTSGTVNFGIGNYQATNSEGIWPTTGLKGLCAISGESNSYISITYTLE